MDEYKKKRTKLIVKVTASVLALAFVLTVSTYSWFYNGNKGSIGNIDINVSEALNVGASTDGNNYSNHIQIELGNDTKLTEYSSDGIYFYKPSFGPTGELIDYYQVGKNTKKPGVIEFSFFIKSDTPFEFRLAPGSKVTPVDPNKHEDNIVGAIRVALMTRRNEADRIIWIPNTTYEYNFQDETVNKSGNVEDKYFFASSEKLFPDPYKNQPKIPATDIYEVQTNGQKAGYDKKTGQVVWGDIGDIEDRSGIKPVFRTVATSPVVNEVVVRMWIEGNDRECQTSLIGGKFHFDLKFESNPITL